MQIVQISSTFEYTLELLLFVVFDRLLFRLERLPYFSKIKCYMIVAWGVGGDSGRRENDLIWNKIVKQYINKNLKMGA